MPTNFMFSSNLMFARSISLLSFLIILVGPVNVIAEKKTEEAPAEPVSVGLPPEYSCGVDLFFSWRREVPPPSLMKPGQAAPTPDPDDFGPRKEFYTRVLLTGPNKEEVERSLKSKIPSELGRAKAACQEAHNNSGVCISAKIESFGHKYQEFDFETRRTLRKRIAEDCQKLEGICLSSEAGTTECQEIKVSPPPSAATPAPAEDKKKK